MKLSELIVDFASGISSVNTYEISDLFLVILLFTSICSDLKIMCREGAYI